MKNPKKIQYHIDEIHFYDGLCGIRGWSFGPDFCDCLTTFVYDKDGQKVFTRQTLSPRPDLKAVYPNVIEDGKYGFLIEFYYNEGETYKIELKYDDEKKALKFSPSFVRSFQREQKWKAIKQLLKSTDSNVSVSAPSTPSISQPTVQDYNHSIYYESVFRRKTMPSSQEIYDQKVREFPENSPKFSIVIPLYKTKMEFLWPLLSSLLNQTYTKFEVCFADGSPEEGLEEQIKVLTNWDPRFQYKKLSSNQGISGNTNEALKMVTGDFVVFSDHDDTLEVTALYEYADAILKNPEIDCLYGDEDKIERDGIRHFDAFFKPDYAIDFLTANNYICHPFCVRKTLIDKYGNVDKEYDGSQDYDFTLRMVEHARYVHHVPKILYHWRSYSESTSLNPASKAYAYDAGKRAILAHYKRVWPEIKIDHIEDGLSPGIYHTIFHFDEKPLVSVIIPNKDHVEDLGLAIESIQTKSTWKNLEFIIVENNSTEEKTWEYYKKIQKKYNNVKVVQYEGNFNYSKINNFGVSFAKGEYLLFMNNDVEMISTESIEEMMGYAQREDVGIVGAQLLYPDSTIQHAGVVVGMNGVAGHAFKNMDGRATYFGKALIAQNVSAVTAAVMLVRKSLFDQLHGFDEEYAVAFNDIDFCLRIREAGKLIVYNPYALFYHYESKSRGAEDTDEKKIRFCGEIARFVKQHESFLRKGDPYYNENLTYLKEDYDFKDLEKEVIGKPFYTDEMIEAWKTKSPEDIVKNGLV